MSNNSIINNREINIIRNKPKINNKINQIINIVINNNT